MTKVFLAAGVAALAIAAPVAAQKGDKEQRRAHAEHTQTKVKAARAERRGGGEARAARVEKRQANVERRAPQRVARAERQETRERPQRAQRAERQERRVQRAERQESRAQRVERRVERRAERPQRAQRVERRVERAERPARIEQREQRVANRIDRQEIRQQRVANRDIREQRIANRIADRDVIRVRDWSDDNNRWVNARGLANACPPGLDKKDNGCMPPGQAKKLLGTVIPADYRERSLPLALRDVYRDDDDFYYRYGDGYVYRVDRGTNLIASLLPLFTGGYMPGQLLPSSYMSNSFMPSYYQPFYQDTSEDYYRYANGYIYEIDPFTGMIEDVDPAFGYGYGVGQMWPSSYSYYNVPLAYRDMYYDTDDYYYRYAPGAIYQVDRGSSLITAVASLLTGGMAVGQPLPMGYDVYNVPLAYRTSYYDTPDTWYRYNNGYIYQVDPTTRLITAVIDAIV